MNKDRDTNFKEHSIFLSEIAVNILNGNDTFLAIPGVREIIAIYFSIKRFCVSFIILIYLHLRFLDIPTNIFLQSIKDSNLKISVTREI